MSKYPEADLSRVRTYPVAERASKVDASALYRPPSDPASFAEFWASFPDQLAARDLRYLGLIGSKAKVKRIYDVLVAEGMPLECLQRVNAPIGLDIGAVSPEEIAVSILAELIAVRRGRIQDPRLAAVSMRWDRVYNRA